MGSAEKLDRTTEPIREVEEAELTLARRKVLPLAVAGIGALALASGSASRAEMHESTVNPNWPGKVELTVPYGTWTPNHPQPPLSMRPFLEVVDSRADLPRYRLPSDPHKLPAAKLYARPTTKISEENSNRVKYSVQQGTILRVYAYDTEGELTKDALGHRTRTWVLARAIPGKDTDAWIPMSDIGWPRAALDQARSKHIISRTH